MAGGFSRELPLDNWQIKKLKEQNGRWIEKEQLSRDRHLIFLCMDIIQLSKSN